MQQTILAIAGKPGLYKLVSRGSNNLIVEALDATHKRMPAFATDRITSHRPHHVTRRHRHVHRDRRCAPDGRTRQPEDP